MELGKIDADAWPWLTLAQQVREHALWIPEEGPPLRPGQRLVRFGRPVEIGISGTHEAGQQVLGIREASEPTWEAQTAAEVNPWAGQLSPSDLEPQTFPTLEPDKARDALTQKLRWTGWPQLALHLAPQEWLERWWPILAPGALKGLAGATWRNPWVPVEIDGRLRVAFSNEVPGAIEAGEVLPPSEAGWRRLLELAPTSGHRFTELENAARFWWGRRIPRDLLSAGRRPNEQLAALHEPDSRRYRTTRDER